MAAPPISYMAADPYTTVQLHKTQITKNYCVQQLIYVLYVCTEQLHKTQIAKNYCVQITTLLMYCFRVM